MRVLLTGGTGFVGPAAAAALAAEGHRVRCLVRTTSDTTALMATGVELELARGDVCDPASLPGALAGIEAVVHVAAVTKAINREEFYRVNADGTRHLAEAAADAGVKRFLHCSSLSVAGPMAGRPVREEDPPAPVSHYGKSKLAGEEAIRRFASRFALTIVRPPIVYGPRDRDFLEIFKMAARGLSLKPGLFGTKRYSLIHVEDLGRALALALARGRSVDPAQRDGAGIYYVSDGGVYAWEEVLREVGRTLGRSPMVLPVPEAFSWPVGLWGEVAARFAGKPQIVSLDKIRELGGEGWACAVDRAIADLGYTPRFPLEKGLAHAASWYRERRWL